MDRFRFHHHVALVLLALSPLTYACGDTSAGSPSDGGAESSADPPLPVEAGADGGGPVDAGTDGGGTTDAADTGPLPDGGTRTLVRVPSSAAGTAGVAVQISAPSSARFRSGKAPVVVVVSGGWASEGLPAAAPYNLEALGFIVVTFNFPGGGTGPTLSGGVYDTRGADSSAATRDVVRFALGALADLEGKQLRDRVPGVTPAADNVGLIGLSNGGNMTLLTLGNHGEALSGVRWLLNWESPIGDGAPNAEAGAIMGSQNPAYDDAAGVFAFTLLAYDPALNVVRTGPPRLGGFYWDLNGNGAFDPGDFRSFPLALNGSNKVFDSVAMSNAAAMKGIRPSPAPAHVPTAAEAAAFWAAREASGTIPSVVAKVPGLLFTVEASVEDHVQIAADHPHVFAQYDALRTAGGRFVRLCADRAYVEAIGGRPYPTAVDNDANTPFTRATLRAAVNPETVPTPLAIRAAAAELADRAATGNLTPNLTAALPP